MRQRVRTVVVARQVAGHHGHAGHAAAVVGKTTLAEADIRIVRLIIIGNLVVLFPILGGNHQFRLGGLGNRLPGGLRGGLSQGLFCLLGLRLLNRGRCGFRGGFRSRRGGSLFGSFRGSSRSFRRGGGLRLRRGFRRQSDRRLRLRLGVQSRVIHRLSGAAQLPLRRQRTQEYLQKTAGDQAEPDPRTQQNQDFCLSFHNGLLCLSRPFPAFRQGTRAASVREAATCSV